MSAYIKTVKKSGRVYRYLRPPGAVGNLIRLSGDLETARRQAKMAILLRAAPDSKNPNRAEGRIAAKLVNNSKVRARRSGKSFALTKAIVVEMMRAQDYRCAVSGLAFDLTWRLGRDIFRNPFAPSLDRKEQKRGYEIENCRLVLSAVNIAINEWGEDVYHTIVLAVAKRLRSVNRRAA